MEPVRRSPPPLRLLPALLVRSAAALDNGAPATTGSSAASAVFIDDVSPLSTTAAASSSGHAVSAAQRNLVIILSVTLGALSIVLLAFLAYIIALSRRGHHIRLPFRRNRTITPIGDDEIASWRNAFPSQTSLEKMSLHLASPAQSRKPSTASPCSLPPSARLWMDDDVSPSLSTVHLISPFSPSSPAPPLVAYAPNARVGLTDEIIPGEEPFIAASRPRKHSFKLAKAPLGHRRDESSRSTLSVKSSWSLSSVFAADRAQDAEDRSPTEDDPESGLYGGELLEAQRSSSAATSYVEVSPSGLSPRPQK